MRIYLSPSNQPANKYVVGNTTEKVQMESVAAKVKAILDSSYNCETVMATLSMGIGSSERPQEAKNKGCDFYLAIHSNAAGGTPPCTAAGAVAFYHPDGKNAKALATAMVKELNAACPIPPNRTSQVASGMTQFDGSGYGEIRSPMQKGIPSALVEVNFHDNLKTAQWIIDSKDAIARALAMAIVDTFGITKKEGTTPPPTPPVTPPPTGDVLYRVQTGAFTKKENADKLAAELKGKGFDTYIVQIDGYYKVQVGAYSQKANADAMLAKIKTSGYDAFITTNGQAQPAPTPPPTLPKIEKGSKVKIKAGAKYYSGANIPGWVMSDIWIVLEVKGDRAVIDKNASGKNSIMSPIKVSDLILA